MPSPAKISRHDDLVAYFVPLDFDSTEHDWKKRLTSAKPMLSSFVITFLFLVQFVDNSGYF